MAQPQPTSFSARFGSAAKRAAAARPPQQRPGGPMQGQGRPPPQMGQTMQRPGPGQGRPPPQNGVQRPQSQQPPNQAGNPNQQRPPAQRPRGQQPPKRRFKPLAIKLRQVQIEGLVLLKIIKHSGEFVAKKQAVSGKLLGLPTNQHTVEVTNCFPEPSSFFKTVCHSLSLYI